MGMKSSVGAGLVAAFNFSSAIGRLGCGMCCDALGPLNTLFISLLLSAVSMLVLWPVSTSIGPLVVFCHNQWNGKRRVLFDHAYGGWKCIRVCPSAHRHGHDRNWLGGWISYGMFLVVF